MTTAIDRFHLRVAEPLGADADQRVALMAAAFRMLDGPTYLIDVPVKEAAAVA
ncbi:MAG: hypothetical protein QM733_04475 [Ilumatobacteraceae bacterium]